MKGPVIDIRGLAVRLGGRDVLQVQRLTIDRGEVVVVLGPNGAGKSTLLKCLLGFSRPAAGDLQVLGHSLSPRARGPLSRLRRRVGYVPQVLAAHSETPLTVREVVAIGRTGIAGLFRPMIRRDWEIIDAWLARLGLADRSRQAYASLSGGEQRKTLIAKAMVQEPEILLLDEPTANLDLFWREQIVETVEQLYAETGLSVLLVCHELEVIPRCSRRLLVLRDGRILADGRPQEILTRSLVEDLYGSRLTLVEVEGRYAAVPAGGPAHA